MPDGLSEIAECEPVAHDCNEHMVEYDDGYGWDCAICWNRTPNTINSKRCES